MKRKLFIKPGKKTGLFLTVLLIASLVLGLLSGCSYQEGDDAKVYKRLTKCLELGDYESANKLVQENTWYKITDKTQASTVIEAIRQDSLHSYYWLPVIDCIDCTDSELIAELDAYLHKDALRWFGLSATGFDDERVRDVWSRCTAGSAGSAFLEGFTQIFEGDPVAGATVLEKHLDADADRKEKIQYEYQNYLESRTYGSVEEYMGQMLAYAILFGGDHAKSMSSFVLPESGARPHDRLHEKQYGDIYVYASIFSYEELSDDLPAALRNAGGEKVLVLDRVAIAGTDSVKLGIDSFMMRSLPEEYMPATLEEVGYVMLIDYGLEKDGIWYAGNATVTVYDVASGSVVYESDKLKGTYDQFYFGESTDVIFGTYPDITNTVRAAISAIK